MNDWQLLREFVDKGADGAFEALVGRYVQMVYGVALREVREHHLAEDVTQAVFAILAQKAGELGEGTVVAGWLFRTTRFAAANALKMQRRRRFHEERAGRLREMMGEEEGREERMRELDGAMARLGEKDRGAVLMRYYRRMELAEVGRAMGISEGAARRRVERAVGKMRGWMKGGDVGAVGAMGVVGMKSVSGMAAGALASAKGGAGAGETVSVLMKGVLKMMYWAKLKLAAMVIVGVSVVGGAGVVTVQRLAADAPKLVAPTTMTVVPGNPTRAQLVARLTNMQNLEVSINKTIDDEQLVIETFRRAHGLPALKEGLVAAYQRSERVGEQIDDTRVRLAETQAALESAQSRIKAGLAPAGDFQGPYDAAVLRLKTLEALYETQKSQVADMEHWWPEFERHEEEMKATMAARTALEIEIYKVILQVDEAKRDG